MEHRNIVIIVGIVVIAMILCGCGPTDKEFESMVNQRITVALEQAEKARRAKPQVIEVRIPEEYSNAVIQRVVITGSKPSAANDKKAEAPKIIKLGSLDEYRTLEVLKANEQFAKQEVEAVEKQLTNLKEGKASLEKQIAEKKDTETTQQRLQIIDFQLQLENRKLASARKYLQEKTTIRQQAENALTQRDKAAKDAKPEYSWYNPKGWWN
jgi:rhodanese-related sulfurtransferase